MRVAVDNGTRIRTPQLTLDDAEALVDPELAPDVVSVAPVVNAQSVTATDDGASHAVATFAGTTRATWSTTTTPWRPGPPFTDTDYTARHRVALLGTTVATALVGGDGTAVVGQTVQFNGVAFQVLGLLTAKGSTGPQDQDDRVDRPADGRAGHAHRLRHDQQHLGEGLLGATPSTRPRPR